VYFFYYYGKYAIDKTAMDPKWGKNQGVPGRWCLVKTESDAFPAAFQTPIASYTKQ